MSKDKKQNNFKFNSYWPYAAVLVVILILNFSSFSSSGVITITPSKFFKFLKDGDVKKVEIVNKREAKVYLNEKATSKEVHGKSKPSQFLPIGLSPNYSFEFGDVQLFQKQLEDTIIEENLEQFLLDIDAN